MFGWQITFVVYAFAKLSVFLFIFAFCLTYPVHFKYFNTVKNVHLIQLK